MEVKAITIAFSYYLQRKVVLLAVWKTGTSTAKYPYMERNVFYRMQIGILGILNYMCLSICNITHPIKCSRIIKNKNVNIIQILCGLNFGKKL